MIKRLHEERGIAMVTALLITMTVLSIGVVVVGTSIHNSGQSAFDRKRVQAIDAAEAGIDAYLSALRSSTGLATCEVAPGTLPTQPPASYQVSVDLYSTWPPTTGSELSCPPPTGVDAKGAVVTSRGIATSSPAVAVTRTMQTEVRLTPIYAGLGQAIFSDSRLSFQNKFTLNGNVANDGDVYTNGDFDLGNNTEIKGSVYAQGFASIGQGVVRQDVWANRYVTLSSGIQIFGNVTASQEYIQLSTNSHVYGNARAGTTISGGTIDGTITPNVSGLGPPPPKPFPQMPSADGWTPQVEAVWTAPPLSYQVFNTTDCTLAKAFINTIATGNWIVRIQSACTLDYSNSSTVNVKGNLAIVTDGGFRTRNNVSFNGVGSKWTMYVMRPYQSGLACTPGTPSPYDVSVSNSTSFNNLQILLYTQCTLNFGNNNAGGVDGQLIGGQVNITNQMVMNYVPIVAPAFNQTGYNADISYLREIVNPTPTT